MSIRFRDLRECFHRLLRGAVLGAIVVPVFASPLLTAGTLRPDGVAVEAGYGSGIADTWLGRLNAQWGWSKLSTRSTKLEFQTRWQTAVGIWRGDRDIFDISLTPVFRLQSVGAIAGLRPYFEGAVGFHYISETRMRGRVLSTNFQFGDHLGIGFQSGGRVGIDICYQFQHLSNASIKRPNAGINFHLVRIGVAL